MTADRHRRADSRDSRQSKTNNVSLACQKEQRLGFPKVTEVSNIQRIDEETFRGNDIVENVQDHLKVISVFRCVLLMLVNQTK